MKLSSAEKAEAEPTQEITATIDSVTPESNEEQRKAGRKGWVMFKGQKEFDTRIWIDDKTKIEKTVGKEKKASSFEDLKNGAKVKAVFVPGGVSSQGIVHGRAKEILILE